MTRIRMMLQIGYKLTGMSWAQQETSVTDMLAGKKLVIFDDDQGLKRN